MQRNARYALLVVTWLFLAGIVVQVFVAGMGLFGAGSMQLHVDLGWALHLVPLIILLLAWPARPGRGSVWLAVMLMATVMVQPFLPMLRQEVPLAAALHPVNALAIFWLGFELARRSWHLVRAAAASPQADATGLQEA